VKPAVSARYSSFLIALTNVIVYESAFFVGWRILRTLKQSGCTQGTAILSWCSVGAS